ncbi:MAG: outer membrane protein assembly factor BamA [Nitrospiraceae bacterium]|nr:outer membrane protein assembly factor BamA [Nitrospiraceae bacterium]
MIRFFTILLGCILLGAVLCPAEGSAPAEQAARAGTIRVDGLYSVGREEFLAMFGIREGSPVSAALVRDGVKRAFLKGIFEDIDVTVGDGEQPEVHIKIRERDFITKVRVEGDYGVSKRVIRDLFPLKEEQAMRYDALSASVEALKHGLSRRGFPSTVVAAAVEKTSRPHRVIVALTVNTGIPLLINNSAITFSPSSTPDQTIVQGIWSEMIIAAGDIYDESRLEQNERRIKHYLKRQGYFRPVAGPAEFREGTLDIAVNPGKRLTVELIGNSALSAGTLLREIPFFESEAFNDGMVDETIDRMISLYHSQGYPYTQIAPVVTADDRSVKATFFVFEGERIKVGSIAFRGVSLQPKRLQGIISLTEGAVYNPDAIDKDKESLREFYGALGYLDAAVKGMEVAVDREKGTASITVSIDEGEKTTIGSVDFLGVSDETKAALSGIAGFKAGDTYNDVDIADARIRIVEHFGSMGFTSADVSVARTLEGHKAAITFRITEGQQKVFGDTVVVGNSQTRYEVIRRELTHREGQPFNVRTVNEERQRLYKLGLFTDVEVDSLDAEGNRRDMALTVHEGNAGSVEFGLGYGEFEKYRGLMEVSYRNLWGMNRQGTFRVELSSLEKRFLLQYGEPWFLGRSLPLKVFFLHENRKELNAANGEILYRLNRYAINAGVEEKLSETLKGKFSYEFSIVRTADVKPSVILTREDTGTIAISGIKPALVYDTRDNALDPRRGTFAEASLKIASLVFLSEANFAKAEFHAARFHALSSRITLALALRGGVAYGIGKTEQLPIVERFFLGGRTSVRGYAQDSLGPRGSDGNPTGGNAFFAGSVEFRTNIGRGVGLVPFFDMGNVWVKAGDINPKDLKFTTGMGLRYNTPVGPLSVDYGVKLRRETGESRGELHFSVGHAF